MEKQTVRWTYRKANTERYKKTDRQTYRACYLNKV